MLLYIVRHGDPDYKTDTLTERGKIQAEAVGKRIAASKIDRIFSSPLGRARQTAEILVQSLNLAVEYKAEFREVNNGDLAGMNNDLANELYPNLYWRKFEWEQHYPNGESPKEFYERVKAAWEKLINSNHKSIILVTHGGVINVIMHLVNGIEYSNKNNTYKIGTADYIIVEV